MTNALTSLILLAAESPGPGRGENPDDGGGILIILGVILLVALAVTAAALLLRRKGRTKTDPHEGGEHPPGRVGRL